MKKFNIKQDNNDMVKHAVDEIILQENNKLSADDEAYENIDSEIYEYDLYEIYDMSLVKNKQKKQLRKRAFECVVKTFVILKTRMV